MHASSRRLVSRSRRARLVVALNSHDFAFRSRAMLIGIHDLAPEAGCAAGRGGLPRKR